MNFKKKHPAREQKKKKQRTEVRTKDHTQKVHPPATQRKFSVGVRPLERALQKY
jgi:hypothetical protein